MLLFGQPLTRGMQVDDIKLLHPYLQQLGYSIPENEINNTLYGTGTAEAVAAFQTKSGLQPTGEVDAATAKAINIAVAALQPDTEPKPDPDKQPNGSLVRGYVRQVDGAPVIGTIVRAYDKDLPSLQRDTPLGELLGETTTDPDGAYAIPYTAEQFSRAEKDSADLVVRAFHGSGGAIAESAVLFNAPPEAQVDLVTKSDGMGLSEYRRFLITVAPLINNIPVADLTTEDVDFLTGETGLDRQFLSFLVIAHRHATTAESAVDAAVFYGLMRAALPVELLLLLAQGPEVQRDALKRAVAENIIPAYVTNNLEVILAQLKALRVRFALQPPGQEQPAPLGVILSTALPSSAQQRTFLSLYTDHQGEIEQFWQKLRNEPEFASDGVVDQLQFSLQLGVLTGGNGLLVQLLRQDKNLTSTRDLVNLDVSAWQERITATLGEQAGHVPPYIAGTTPEEKIANYAGSIVETLKSAFPTLYVARGLGEKPAVDTPLVKQVLALNEGLDLSQPLPDTLNWGDIPAGQHTKARASLSALQAELAMFPNLDVQAALASDGFTNPIREGVQKVLQNDPDFDFGTVHLDAYMAEQGDKVFADVDQALHEPVTQQLKAMQRIYHVVPRYEAITALMGAGIDSSRAITNIDPEVFVRQFGPHLGALQAQLTYDQAVERSTLAEVAFGAAMQAARDVDLYVLPRPTVPPHVRATYPELFGRLDLCACEHCRSVYSPAAYFVDLLHFLARPPWQSTPVGFLRPLGVLTRRRPDLLHLPLTCENTHTEMPYIDLVNEVLETYVVHNAILNRTLGDTGATSSAELLASPERVNATAYATLKGAVYPFTLPFDRDLELIRTYLAHLGTSRYAVMKTFQRTRPLSADVQTDLAIEYLTMSSQERDLLTGAIFTSVPPRTLAELYGFPGDVEVFAKLPRVTVFLESTGLTYAELAEILKTRFVNPVPLDNPEAVVVDDPDDSCDVARRFLRLKKGSALTAERWDTLQRFIRLWRKLGWPIHDVDRALTALRVTDVAHVDLRFLRQLGQVAQIKDDLGLSLADTLSLWAPIDTHGDDEDTRQRGSLYARLFLSRTVRTLAASPEAFDLNPDAPVPEDLWRITANRVAIQAALRITADDLAAIREVTSLEDRPEATPPLFPLLSLENLSQLHRHAVLPRVLRMPVRELLDLQTLTGVDPFAPPSPTPGNGQPTEQEGTSRFVELARKVHQSTFSVALLNYLYRHIDDPAHSSALRLEEAVLWLDALRVDLRKIADDTQAPGAAEERLRDLLARVVKDASGIDAMLALPDGLPTFTAPLDSAPSVTWPAALSPRVSYDPTSKRLRFTGVMSVTERETLVGLPGGTDPYRAAVSQLYERPREVLLRPLSGLMDEAEILAHLIDATREARRSYLKGLQPRALDYLSTNLVVQHVADALPLEPEITRVLLRDVLTSPHDAAKPLLTDFVMLRDLMIAADRPATVNDFPAPLRDGLTRLHKVALLVTTFGLSVAEVHCLTRHGSAFGHLDLNTLPVAASPRAADPPTPAETTARAAYERMTHENMAAWERVVDFVALRNSLKPGADVAAVIHAGALEAAQNALLAASGWSETVLQTALGRDGFNVTDVAWFRDVEHLSNLAAGITLSRTIGANPDQLFTWVDVPPRANQVREVQSVVKAKYGEQQWLTIARGLNDPLRERCRDALVAYILTLPSIRRVPLRNADELFEYFLIDVKMDACMTTSRIRQAISSVQLFIHRCFMNLEPWVAPNALRADWWQWMRNYRVWEANRKVFLYPENWIEPELRDDKSPFFKDLENELLQNDVTTETVEAALVTYLEKLDEVARLDMRAMYWEHESEVAGPTWDDRRWTEPDATTEATIVTDDAMTAAERTDILHVFGRTQGTPPIYYYRRLINHTMWTPWEKVQADIEGDHLIPVVFNRRLYLFWPTFRESQSPPQDTTRQPEKRLEIQLAWSECKDGKWSGKKLTLSKLETDYMRAEDYIDFFFSTEEQNNGLILHCRRQDQNWGIYDQYIGFPPFYGRPGANAGRQPPRNEEDIRRVIDRLGYGRFVVNRPLAVVLEPTTYTKVGYFEFSGCDQNATASSINQRIADMAEEPRLPGATDINAQIFIDKRVSSSLVVRDAADNRMLLLWDALRGYRLLYPHQYYPNLLQSPFFYQDTERTYFVTPEQVANRVEQVAQASLVEVDFSLASFTQPSRGRQLAGATGMGNSSGLLQTQPPDAKTVVGSYNVGVGASLARGTALEAMTDRSSTTSLVPQAMTRWTTVICPGDWSAQYRDDSELPDASASLKLRFHTFFHPHVCAFIRDLKRLGIPGLLTLASQERTNDGQPNRTRFEERYSPTDFVDQRYPHENVDFEGGAYASYNWELFFHIPLLIATRLSQNQRFEDARRWFHFMFDPTTNAADRDPRRFWKTLPFHRNDARRDRISELLQLLSYHGNDPTLVERKAQVEAQVQVWRDDPFNPHHIARLRITAYQKTVVMKYLDNIIAWGDQLFRQDTIESINEATQLYVLAYLMLGSRPETIPPTKQPPVKTYHELSRDLDSFSNALVATENTVAGRRCAPSTPRRGMGMAGSPTLGTLYFCVPQNDKLLGYWDTVEDRLFKIRNCMNIEGVVRQLPLFEPPIDPALLVRARAAGLDLGSVLNEAHTGLPHYRFTTMLQKALELCAEVRALGGTFLAALEKRDAEDLALLRSTHEIRLLEQVRQVRQKQIEEANETLAGLQRSKDVVETRLQHYELLLGQNNPDRRLNAFEQAQLHLMQQGIDLQQIQSMIEYTGNLLSLIPDSKVGAPTTAGATFGGSNIGNALKAFSAYMGSMVGILNAQASMNATKGGFQRRAEEWTLQRDLATREKDQINKQITAATIRRDIATQELHNHDLQIEQAKLLDEFMRSRKFTRKELYDWMSTQLSTLYFQSYQLAYDLAKRAERAYQFERGLASLSFIRFGQWESLKRGLLAGEQLTLDLKRLEAAYLDQNRREYEITKHVSLVLHDPLALIALKTTGQCVVRLSEAFFDADYPGHYMRRIKSMSLTIPAVVGPYTSVNCTLTLLSNKTRINNTLGQPYAENIDSSDLDHRFIANFATVQSIATSHAQNDSGMFELNFRDERYLPFEGGGAISEWRIDMPKDCNAFDFNSITDVVLRISYTARDGGEALRDEARQVLGLEARPEPSAEPLALRRLFSLKHEFATQWFRFLQASASQTIQFDLAPERFPFQFRRNIHLQKFDVFLVWKREPESVPAGVSLTKPDGAQVMRSVRGEAARSDWPLTTDDRYNGLLRATIEGVDAGLDAPPGGQPRRPWSLSLTGGGRVSPEHVEDILVVCEFTA